MSYLTSVLFVIFVPSESFEKKISLKNSKITLQNDIDFYENLNAKNADESLQNSSQSNGKSFTETPFQEKITMIQSVKEILNYYGIINATYYQNEDNFVQITFPIKSQEKCEQLLEAFKKYNIGQKYSSAVTVVPCAVHYQKIDFDSNMEADKWQQNEYTTWNTIITSIRARLNVAQIVENIKARSIMTFDFLCLIFISSTMCAIGLVENSTVCLLSSMVMSPMMGPVMATTFGGIVQDKYLQKMGVKNEFFGLGLATIIGFFCGATICLITDKYGTLDWPTYEITSRGELKSLWIGCIIALLSGAAVALGILSDNIASLVGVAISTSLLPPAVNAGILWSMASIYYIKGNDVSRYSNLKYERHFSNNDGMELMILGCISMCLTFINIICVYVAALVIFKIKEVAPIASRNKLRRQFWQHDIKIARDYNRSLRKFDGEDIYKRLSKDIETFKRRGNNCDYINHSFDSINRVKHQDNLYLRNENTWSSCFQTFGPSYHNSCSTFRSDQRKNKFENITCPKKLSQIFEPGGGPKSNENVKEMEKQPGTLKTECCQEERKKYFTQTKQFIVTPCENDPLLAYKK